VQRRCCMCL